MLDTNTQAAPQTTSQTAHLPAKQDNDFAGHSNVVNIRSARKAQQQAQQELLDYMMWTMKHDMDPHRLYDDPIEVFRSEMKAKIKASENVA